MDLENLLNTLCQIITESDYDLSFGLNGEIGSGKTHLVQKLTQRLDLETAAQVSSPTFTYHQLYLAESFRIHHFDLYRVERKEQLEEIGIFEILEAEGLKFVEWSNLYPEVETDWRISISLESNRQRFYSLEKTIG